MPPLVILKSVYRRSDLRSVPCFSDGNEGRFVENGRRAVYCGYSCRDRCGGSRNGVGHQAAKGRTITGCVDSGESGMLLTNEKDKHVYVLSGNTAGVKPGDRMTLTGKKTKSNSGATLVWDTKSISKDFGTCRP
jgi:hypothetical protein